MKRPKDMTIDELEALPEGPNIERTCTREDGVTVHYTEYGRFGTAGIEPDDIATAILSDGVYSFGQWPDGTWYKERLAPL